MVTSPFRIFSRISPVGEGPPRPGDLVLEASTVAPVVIEATAPNEVEQAIIAILDRDSVAGESIQKAFDRREAELRALFAGLSNGVRAELHARLGANAPNDALATRFARLSTERRNRLLNQLEKSVRGKAVV